MKIIVKNLLEPILDIVMPPSCISCGVMVEKQGNICGICWAKINFIAEPMCNICGHPFQYEMPGANSCANCIRTQPEFAEARAVFHYDENSKGLITSYKFSDRTHATETFARLMASSGRELLSQANLIVPVPLHYFRLFKRRYNQAALLSIGLAKITGLPAVNDMLLKIKNTVPQSSLSRKARQKNVKGAFKFNGKYRGLIEGKSIILVDDVLTTGATLNACARILTRAGAKKVGVLTLARTV